MIVKRNFNPIKVWGYVKTPMTIGACWATVVYLLIFIFDQKSFALNFTPVGVLGSALRHFLSLFVIIPLMRGGGKRAGFGAAS